MKISINTKLVVLAVLLIVVPSFIMGMIGYQAAEKAVTGGVESRLQDQALQIALDTKSIYDIAQTKVTSDLNLAKKVFYAKGKATIDTDGTMILIDESKEALVQKKVNSDIIVAKTILYSKGKPFIDANEKVTIEAVNQITKEKKSVTISPMKINGKTIVHTYDIVDEIKSTSNVETATIFQVIPEGLLRVSTNVMALDGSRAIDTFIPIDSPVYQSVMRKETYKGTAFVVNAWYKTVYEPILDEKGELIGVLFVGAKESKHVVNNNFEIVDEVKSLVGGTSTIFQLKKFEGVKESDVTTKDWPYEKAMYRVSTNVQTLGGARALGTILSKPVYDKIMKGETYYGRAFVVTGMYLTAYEPIRDSKTNEIIGVLYVGVKESDFQTPITNNLVKQVIGETGYIFIYDKSGNYILSKNRELDGKNVLEAKDELSAEARKIIDAGTGLPEGKSTVVEYQWKNTGESNARNKIAGVAYMKEWEWVIGAGAYPEEDFGGAGGLKAMQNTLITVCAIAVVIGIIVSLVFANMITGPLKKMTAAGNKIADGKLDTEIPVIKTGDEVEDLSATMNMLVGAVKFLKGDKK